MSVYQAKNNLSILIGKNVDWVATQYTDPAAAGFIADGEILIIEEDGTLMTAASTLTTSPRFRFVQRSGATAATARLIYSPLIHGANVISYTGVDGTAATEQTTTIGYNGTSGSIDVAGTEDYIMNLTFNFDEAVFAEQLNNFPFIVDAQSGAITQDEVAASLVKQINNQMSNNGQISRVGEGPLVRATMRSADAGAAIGAAADTVIGFAGSKTVTITDTGADNSVTGLFVAGDYFRAGTATTSPVYKVVTSTVTAAGGVLTLDTPLQANVSLLGTTAEIITEAGAEAAAAGLAIVGQTLKWQLDFFKYMQVTFKVGLKQGFGDTDIATTAAVRPRGSGLQIAEIESFCEGFRGKLNRTIIPLPTAKNDADTAATYDVISIVWEDTTDTSPIDGTKPARQEVMLAIYDGALQGADILGVLNPYMLTTPRALANVSI